MAKRSRRYRCDAMAAVHETAHGLRDADVMDKRTMKSFDAMCFTPIDAGSRTKNRTLGMTKVRDDG